MIELLDAALAEAETWLAQNQPAGFREDLLAFYFRLHSFRRTAELYDERLCDHHRNHLIHQGAAVLSGPLPVLLRQALARGHAAIFFSATLTPMDYYLTLLGGTPEDPVLQLPSPFPPENLAVFIEDRIRPILKSAPETIGEVVDGDRDFGARTSWQLPRLFSFLPISHRCAGAFHARSPSVPVLVQRPGMNEPERDAFLAAFSVEHGETLVGFAVMGGIFGEGIDLVGERLIGAVIVGVGLPQLCVERDLIRDYFQARNRLGL